MPTQLEIVLIEGQSSAAGGGARSASQSAAGRKIAADDSVQGPRANASRSGGGRFRVTESGAEADEEEVVASGARGAVASGEKTALAAGEGAAAGGAEAGADVAGAAAGGAEAAVGGAEVGAEVAGGPVGIAVGVVVEGLKAVGSAAMKAGQILEDYNGRVKAEAQRIGDYSAALTAANAQAELRELMTDMRRAQQIGPELAGARTAGSRLDEAVSDLKSDFLEKTLPLLTGLLNAAAIGVNGIAALEETSIAIFDAMTLQWPSAWKEFNKATKHLKNIEEILEGDDTIKADPFLAGFLHNFEGKNPLQLPEAKPEPGA